MRLKVFYAHLFIFWELSTATFYTGWSPSAYNIDTNDISQTVICNSEFNDQVVKFGVFHERNTNEIQGLSIICYSTTVLYDISRNPYDQFQLVSSLSPIPDGASFTYLDYQYVRDVSSQSSYQFINGQTDIITVTELFQTSGVGMAGVKSYVGASKTLLFFQGKGSKYSGWDTQFIGGGGAAYAEELNCPAYMRIVGLNVNTRSGTKKVLGFRVLCDYVECNIYDFNVNTCHCDAGYQKKLGTYGYFCDDCLPGTFQDVPDSLSCKSCPYAGDRNTGVTWTNPAASTSQSSCSYTCNAGYYYLNQYCQPCPAGTYQPYLGQLYTACWQCSPGGYSLSGAQACTSCTAGATYQDEYQKSSCKICSSTSPAVGYYTVPCTAAADVTYAPCTTCSAGQQLQTQCVAGNSLTASPPCVSCPVGSYNPAPGVLCTLCSRGTYASSPGAASCASCANKPANSVYAIPASTSDTTSATCPYWCNAGYYRVSSGACTLCAVGTYSALNSVACTACTKKPSNAYYVTTISVFNRSWDGCPWDCNAGYQSVGYTACAQCVAGSTYKSAGRTSDSLPVTSCAACTVCGAGSYTSRACSTTQNAACTACLTQCTAGKYLTPCATNANSACVSCLASCGLGFYKATLCTGYTYSDTVTCVPCTPSSSCEDGTFIDPSSCPGTTTSDVGCALCATPTCPTTKYLQRCTKTNNAVCQSYPTCTAGNFLMGAGVYSSGACTNCTNCTKLGQGTVSVCSQSRDTVCSGSPCNYTTPCTAQQFCDYSSGSGRCSSCPSGFFSNGLVCQDCQRRQTCNQAGARECAGEVLPGLVAVCVGGLSQPDTTVACGSISNGRAFRGGFAGANAICNAYVRCDVGYYRAFSASGVIFCLPCQTTSSIPALSWLASGGVMDNNPYSCLVECKYLWAEATQTCTSVQGSYPVNNPAGFYEISSNIMVACPPGYTSVANNAINASHCMQCLSPQDTIGDPCGDWACLSSKVKRAHVCVNQQQCPPGVQGYVFSNGLCSPSPAPWPQNGYYATGISLTLTWNPSTNVGSPPQGTRLNISITYPRAGIQAPTVLTYEKSNWTLLGPVCSYATGYVSGQIYAYVAYCNTSWIGYVKLSGAGAGVPRRLIGRNTSGYAEGFRDTAQFQDILGIATSQGDGTVVYVADQLNCLLRIVNIPSGKFPGDYLVRSYKLYGVSEELCLGDGTLKYPYAVTPIIDTPFLVVWTENQAYMLDTYLLQLIQLVGVDPTPSAAGLAYCVMRTGVINCSGTYGNAIVTITTARCPNGTTSFNTWGCLQVCSQPQSYVNQAGLCVACTQKTCSVGYYLQPCSPLEDSKCLPCPNIPLLNGRYRRVYFVAGSCEFRDTTWVAPCPSNYYYGPSGVCIPCPSFSYTLTDDAVSIDQCRCVDGATRLSDGSCVIGQLYDVPTPTACKFGTYPRGVFEKCSVCSLDPIRSCAVGLFLELDMSKCSPCVKPTYAVFTSGGLFVGSPSSCSFECAPGYYQVSNLSLALQCQPCTNRPSAPPDATVLPISNSQINAPAGCTWACVPPYALKQGVCVPCVTYNPLHVQMHCTVEGLVVSSTGSLKSSFVTNGVSYTTYTFYQTGTFKVSINTTANILIVGGGGGGGAGSTLNAPGGGGGAGEVRIFTDVLLIANKTYQVSAGQGGAGVVQSYASAAGSSFFDTLQAFKGGSGGFAGLALKDGYIGASSGGGAAGSSSMPAAALAGYQGGTASGTTTSSAGGGGAGGAGGNAAAGSCAAGAGGLGVRVSLFAETELYLAWGGDGACANSMPASGPPQGTGAGGTGGGNYTLPGGSGGSGLIVVQLISEPCACIV